MISKLEKFCGIKPGGILRQNRTAHVAEARQALMYYCSEVLKMSYKEVEQLVQRDRTTIRHGVNKVIRKLIEGDKRTEEIIECLRCDLRSQLRDLLR